MDHNTGFYSETMPLILHREKQVITTFRHRAVFKDDDGYHTERQMVVEGKQFFIRSIFPSAPKATPTEQFIKLIDCGTKAK